MEEDAGDYLYNLAGIVVHAGVAQGGHYYSYIRDRGKQAYEHDNGIHDSKATAGGGARRGVGAPGTAEGVDGGKVGGWQ